MKKVIFSSEEVAVVIIAILAVESTHFSVMPLPDGEYEIEMRDEMPGRLLTQIKSLRNCLRATMNSENIDNVSGRCANVPVIMNISASLRVGFTDQVYESIVKVLNLGM